MKRRQSFAEKFIGQFLLWLALAGLVYWYSHLWHHTTAEVIHFWPHAFVLGGILWLLSLGEQDKKGGMISTAMRFAMIASLITQGLVWLDVLKAPIF